MTRTSLILAIVATSACGISDQERGEVLRGLEAGLSAAARLEQKRAEGTAAFFARAEVENLRCTQAVLFGHPYQTSLGNHRVILPQNARDWNVTATDLASVSTLKGRRHQAIEAETRRLRAQITGKGLEAGEQAIKSQKGLESVKTTVAEYGDPSWYRFEIIYATMKIENALMYKGAAYPSFIRGRAMVWDYQTGKVVCSGQDEDKAIGTSKILYRRSTGVTDADMLQAVKEGLRDAIFMRTLLRLGVGVPPKPSS